MAKRKKELTEEQIAVLERYIQLEFIKFGKTKKQKIQEIQKKTKKNINTIISWISRHLEEYRKFREEVRAEKNARICTNPDLTDKQSKYLTYRMSGYGKEEAKIKAGYSEQTKVANIERNPKVAKSILEMRALVFEDERLGALAIATTLGKIMNKGINGVEVTEYIDESNPDGRVIRKTVKREFQLGAGVAAAKELNNMFGYKLVDEAKLQQYIKSTDKKDVTVSEEDFE